MGRTELFDHTADLGMRVVARAAFEPFAGVPNVARFAELAESFKALLVDAAPGEEQQRDLDYLLTLGELFTLIPYGQLICEQAGFLSLPADTLDQIFDVLIRDFSAYAVQLHGKTSATEAQASWARAAITRRVGEPRGPGRRPRVCILESPHATTADTNGTGGTSTMRGFTVRHRAAGTPGYDPSLLPPGLRPPRRRQPRRARPLPAGGGRHARPLRDVHGRAALTARVTPRA